MRVIAMTILFLFLFFGFFLNWMAIDDGGYSEQAPLRIRVLQNGLNPGHQQLAVSYGTW